MGPSDAEVALGERPDDQSIVPEARTGPHPDCPHSRVPVDQVTALTTGEILSTRHIDPDHTHWRNQGGSPGRWPRLEVNGDPAHL